MIQQSINQTLSLASFMYSQTEDARARQEDAKLKTEMKRTEQGLKELKEKRGEYKYKKIPEEIVQLENELQGKKVQLSQDIFKNYPSKENLQLLTANAKAVGVYEDKQKTIEKQKATKEKNKAGKARQEADEALALAQAEKLETTARKHGANIPAHLL